jgi:hypothetical protein
MFLLTTKLQKSEGKDVAQTEAFHPVAFPLDDNAFLIRSLCDALLSMLHD